MEENSIPQEVMVRLDKLAETIGTSVSHLFSSLYADAVRYGWAQIIYGAGMILLGTMIIVVGGTLGRYLMRDLSRVRPSKHDMSAYECWRNGIYIPLFVVFIIFTGVGLGQISDGVDTLSQPTQYAIQSLSGLFR